MSSFKYGTRHHRECAVTSCQMKQSIQKCNGITSRVTQNTRNYLVGLEKFTLMWGSIQTVFIRSLHGVVGLVELAHMLLFTHFVL